MKEFNSTELSTYTEALKNACDGKVLIRKQYLFHFVNTAKTWEAANKFCNNTLVSIWTEFVSKKLEKHIPKDYNYWIGARK